jgi:hypothetical protein
MYYFIIYIVIVLSKLSVVIGNDEYFWISLFSILNVFICYIILWLFCYFMGFYVSIIKLVYVDINTYKLYTIIFRHTQIINIMYIINSLLIKYILIYIV